MTYDDDIIIDGTFNTGNRGRDWRRAQRDVHPSRRRVRSDTEVTTTRRDKPGRLLREAVRLACLISEGEA